MPVTEIPMRVGNLDVLAPIVSELPQLGATVTRCDPKNIPGGVNTPTEDQYFQINVPDGPPIVLTMGHSTAWIGTNQVTLRAAPLVIDNEIWLPVVSVTQLLAAANRLGDDGTLYLTPTIESVELFPVKGTVALTVKASAPIMPGTVKIGNLRDRIYVDFPGYSMGFDSSNSTTERVVAPSTGDVLRARAGMPLDLPTTTRVTLDLDQPLQYQTTPLPDSTLFALVLTGPGNGRAPRIADNPPLQVPSPGQETLYQATGSANLQGVTIVIDPGHGGKDQGAHGTDSLEKNDTLDISLRLRDMLVARHANVLMTRDADYFVSLDYRTTFANSHHADIFVAIHENASPNPAVTGTETFYFTEQSLNLAREVHKQLILATGCPDRGVSQARFYVIRNTWMPSILTESAFITNPGEQAKLDDPGFRAKIAAGIANGITNYVMIYGRAGLAG